MHEKFFKIKNIFFLLFLSLINLFGSVKKQYKPFCRDSLKKVTFSDQDFSKEKFSKKVLDPLKVFKREKRNLLLQKCLENIFFSAFKSEAPLGKKQIRYDLLHDWLFLEKIKNDKKKNLFFAKMVAEYCSQKGLREKGYRFLVQYLLRIKKTYGISFADTSNTGKFFSYFSKNKNFKCVVRQFHFFRTNPINMKLLILCFKNQLYRGFSKQSDSMICKIMKKILSPRFDSLSLSLKDGVLICENVYNALYDEMLNKIDCDIAMFENLHLLLVKLIKKMSKKECHDVDLLYTLSSFYRSFEAEAPFFAALLICLFKKRQLLFLSEIQEDKEYLERFTSLHLEDLVVDQAVWKKEKYIEDNMSVYIDFQSLFLVILNQSSINKSNVLSKK